MNTEHLIFGLFLNFALFITFLFFLQRMRLPEWVRTTAKVDNVTFDTDGCIVLLLDFEIASEEDPTLVQRYRGEELADEPFSDKFGSDEKRIAKFSSLGIVDLWYARNDPGEIHLKRPDNFQRFCGALLGAVVMGVFFYFTATLLIRDMLFA